MICSRQMKAVQGRVAQLYYTHGLFCASHPLPIICGVICLALLACYPLTNLPLPGNAPVEVNTPIKDYILPTPPRRSDDPIKQRWYLSQPVAYVQQIVVKTTVSPWERSHMIPTDAVRGPLAKVFQVLNHIQNFKITDRQNKISIDDVCLRVGDVVSNKRLRRFFPEFNCLIVSPANFWHSDMKSFALDGDELKTVNRMYGQPLETSPTLQDLLFGVPWKKTGMSGYFLRNRRRTITYAVTILYKTFSPRFTAGLQESLEIAFPEKWASVNQTDIDYLVHVLYKDVNYFVEYTPLLVIYLLLLLYLYFSVRKIEMVKSKWGLAISAVATVIASLFMSVSICTVFGLTPTLNGGEIFPYLVVIIGLENVLVLTKSVVSTPVHLDVKYRVAQGLSKEGWSITKNLVAELLILLIGFFTFVPAIQEFCAFAVVGLLSDFFLQLVFFATVLSVDIRRMELSDLQRQSVQQEMSVEELSFPVIEPLIRCPVRTRLHSGDAAVTGSLKRSRSAPGLDFVDSVDASPPHDVTSCQGWSPSHLQEVDDPLFPSPAILPRRLRFLYFWARTRMFQRAIMVCTIIWIGLIMYKAGLVEKLAAASESLSDPGGGSPANGMESGGKGARQMGSQGGFNGGFPGSGGGHWMSERDVESQQSLPREEETGPEHSDLEMWRHLSFKHWRTLLRYYNISLSGRHISILPSVHLSITVTPEEALKLRHPDKSHKEAVNNQAPGSPEAIQQRPSTSSQTPGENGHPTPAIEFYYPQGLKEFTITVVLALLSVFLLLYFMVILYKCCCSRNYDKWRSSWSKKSKRAKGKYFRELRDSLPIILKGHMLDIECLCTDGPLVVSSCLGGQLRVWDSNSGECLTIIQRRGVTPPMKRKPCVGRNVEDSDADLYAEFHGEDASDEEEMLQFAARNRSKSEDEPEGSQLMLDNLASRSRHSLGSSLPFTPFSTAEGENNVTGLSRRRVRALSERPSGEHSGEAKRDRSWSTGSGLLSSTEQADLPAGEQWTAPSIWCLACQDNLVISGCGNGRIEFWDGLTGVLRYLYDDYKVGVTCLCVNGNRVMAARLGGEIDFLELETFQNPAKSLVQQTTTLHNRGGHIRNSSGPGESLTTAKHWEEIIRYNLLERYHGHQQPINCLKSVGGRVVSASIDHTLKVFRVEDCACLYTLHGHLGSVTALYLDKIPPYAAISGSEDGKVRLWDLVTGACVHQMEGQSGMVTSLVGTSQFVISCGQDNVLCVWERSHGQLVHRIHNDVCGFTSLAMMFSNILVTGGEGCVCLWDVNKGEMVRRVGVGSPYRPASINYVQLINNTTVICDYANQIHVIHFPTVLEKSQ